MKVITRESLARSAAERWARQYRMDREATSEHDLRTHEIGYRLRGLGPNPEPDDVDRVIGNGSWTRPPSCNECGTDAQGLVVRVGEEPDYESSTAHLCLRCVGKLLLLVGDTTGAGPMADWLEERGQGEAAAMLRAEFLKS